MVAVSKIYRETGIYRKLRLEINKVALMHNYKYVVGELSSALTQKFLLERWGIRLLLKLNIKYFSTAEIYRLSLIREPTSIVLCEHKIS